MSLMRYAGNAHMHAEELAEELEAYGLNRLRELCRVLGEDQFLAFAVQNRKPALDYLRATPSQRKKMHRKLDERDRILFVLGCLYFARMGAAFLHTLDQHPVEPGGPYRRKTATAAQAAYDFYIAWPSLWPFDDPDPFDQDNPV